MRFLAHPLTIAGVGDPARVTTIQWVAQTWIPLEFVGAAEPEVREQATLAREARA